MWITEKAPNREVFDGSWLDREPEVHAIKSEKSNKNRKSARYFATIRYGKTTTGLGEDCYLHSGCNYARLDICSLPVLPRLGLLAMVTFAEIRAL
jgi:hypothetical protein